MSTAEVCSITYPFCSGIVLHNQDKRKNCAKKHSALRKWNSTLHRIMCHMSHDDMVSNNAPLLLLIVQSSVDVQRLLLC